DLDLALHVPVDDLRHVSAAARATERRALPGAASDQLERTGRDLLASARNADDDRLAPAAMRAFERLTHDLHIAGAVEGVVGATDLVRAALRHVDDVLDDVAVDLGRVDEMGHAEALAPFLLRVVDVDADDHVGTGKLEALDHVEADSTEAEHGSRCADLDLGRVDDGTDAGRHAAADVADLVERRVRIDLRDRDLGQDREVREGRATHVVEDLVLADREAAGAVGHQALTLRGADCGAQVRLAAEAGRALAAFRRVE